MFRNGLIAVCLGALALSQAAAAAELDATSIMQEVDRRYRGDAWTTISNVALIDKDNSRSVRKIKAISKMYGRDEKSLTVVLEPARIRGTSFLAYDWADIKRENEAWVFLPDLGRVTRLSTANRADYFLGSDFSYGDLEGLKVEEFEYRFADESAPESQVAIDAEPRKDIRDKVIEKTGYQRIRYWIDKDKRMIVKAKYWLKDPGWTKYYTVSDFERIKDVWVGKREQMVMTHQNAVAHATVMTVEKIDINVKVDDAVFSTYSLEKPLQ